MPRIKNPILLTILAVGCAVVPLNLMAGDSPCIGTLTGTHDNVIVPPGATCLLTGALVHGNVKALENSRLVVNVSTVGGSVDGDKADLVQVNFSTVRGDINIKEGGPSPAPSPPGGFTCADPPAAFTPCEALVHGSTIQEGNVQLQKMVGTTWLNNSSILKGNAKVEDNFAAGPEFPAIVGSSVSQNIQFFKNKGPTTKYVFDNTAGESIQCFENDPPVVGGPNTAPKKEGQCF